MRWIISCYSITLISHSFGDARRPGHLELMILPRALRRAAEARRRRVYQVTSLEAYIRITIGKLK
jgi:hypothetical protein